MTLSLLVVQNATARLFWSIACAKVYFLRLLPPWFEWSVEFVVLEESVVEVVVVFVVVLEFEVLFVVEPEFCELVELPSVEFVVDVEVLPPVVVEVLSVVLVASLVLVVEVPLVLVLSVDVVLPSLFESVLELLPVASVVLVESVLPSSIVVSVSALEGSSSGSSSSHTK